MNEDAINMNDNTTNMVIAKNDFVTVKVESFGLNEFRIVFYDSDGDYINDWSFYNGADISEEITEIQKVLASNSSQDMIKWLSQCEPDRKVVKPETFVDYLKLTKQYAKEFLNRIGEYIFIYNE